MFSLSSSPSFPSLLPLPPSSPSFLSLLPLPPSPPSFLSLLPLSPSPPSFLSLLPYLPLPPSPPSFLTFPLSWLTHKCCLFPFTEARAHMATLRMELFASSCFIV